MALVTSRSSLSGYLSPHIRFLAINSVRGMAWAGCREEECSFRLPRIPESNEEGVSKVKGTSIWERKLVNRILAASVRKKSHEDSNPTGGEECN